MRKRVLLTSIAILALLDVAFSQGEAPAPKDLKEAEQEFAGELFGVKVPLGNYYIIRNSLVIFGRNGALPLEKPEEIENATWDELLFSFEAYRRGIGVEKEEFEKERDRILTESNSGINWKKDTEAYAKWVKEKTGEPIEVFENQIKHIIQLERLKKQVMEGFRPRVEEKEAYDLFLHERNNIDLELVKFEDKIEAEKFYRRVRLNPLAWEELRAKSPQEFKKPGFVTFIFLREFWKMPSDALFKIAQLKIGQVYKAIPIYKGFAVCKVLAKRLANIAEYPKVKYAYVNKIEASKKIEEWNAWVQKLKSEAAVTVYKRGG